MNTKTILAPVTRTKRSSQENLKNALDILDRMLPTARSILKEKLEVRPILIIVRKDFIDFVEIQNFFKDDETKSQLHPFVSGLCVKDDVLGLGTAMEGWISTEKEATSLRKAPSECPGRKECLIVYAEWRDCSQKHCFIPFHREDDKIVLDEDDKIAGDVMFGRMAGFFTGDKSNLH